jgi:hypothetical protein
MLELLILMKGDILINEKREVPWFQSGAPSLRVI